MADVFTTFAKLVENKFYDMAQNGDNLYVVDVNPDDLWNLYLDSIPAHENPIFRTNRMYDSNYDKNFIRALGNVVAIKNNKLVSIWDVKDESFFGDVAEILSNKVKNSNIVSIFQSEHDVVGHSPNMDSHDPNITWTHFFAEIPVKHKLNNTYRGRVNSNATSLEKSLSEVSVDTIKDVLDLIEDNAIYRGKEHKHTLEIWLKHIQDYNKSKNKQLYIWEKASKQDINLRNTVIGSLILDLESGMDIDSAVKSFESKVAPSNYKRTSSVITPKMIQHAKDTLSELGYLNHINRRFATEVDIPREHVLFKSQAKKSLDIFDDLTNEANKSTAKVNLDNIKDIALSDFVNDIHQYENIELLPIGNIKSQQMVITTNDVDNNKFFKWNNNFAWSYINSDTTDAIKERVKEMGGDVDADVRVSLSWHTGEDLDLHAYTSDNGHIFFSNKRYGGGYLDLDMNGLDKFDAYNPVENLIWKKESTFPNKVEIDVKHFGGFNNDPSRYGFDLQVEINGEITTYRFTGNMKDKGRMRALTLNRKNGKIIIDNIDSSLKLVSKTTIHPQFIEVDSIMLSPNYWESKIGNEHIFFITKDFEIENDVRGFFNEYLSDSLREHRKVFEILGEKSKITDNKNNALRGYGFSSTMENELIVRTTRKNRKELFKIKIK